MALDAIGIVSENLKESVHFYSLLGVNLSPVGGDEHFEGDTKSGVRIMLDSLSLMKKINPNFQKASGVGIVLCFKQPDAQTVDDLFRKIVDNGFRAVKEPWDAFWGQRYCNVLDPDGNQIDIFCDLAT